MEAPDKMLGGDVKVLMDVLQQTESGQQNKHPFQRFKKGYDTKAVFSVVKFHDDTRRINRKQKGVSRGARGERRVRFKS